MEEIVTVQDRKRKKFPVTKMIVYAVLVLYSIFLFAPILTILVSSFIPGDELARAEWYVWGTAHPTFDGYVKLFTEDPYILSTGIPSLILGIINTLWMTLVPLVVGLLVSGLSAYAFSKLRFPGREKLFEVMVIISMVPLGAFGVISYIFYSTLGWINELGWMPLVIPGMFGSISTVFFLRMYFDGIPTGLLEAARIDGAGTITVFFRIMWPLARPAFIAQFIFGFVGGYNNYMSALLYLNNNPDFITLQLVLSKVTTLFPGAEYKNVWCASSIIGILPLIVIYCFTQKYFLEGITAGGVKE